MQLHRDRDRFAEAGVRLAVIGQGTPRHAGHFRDSHDLDIPLYVDKARRGYKAAGAKVGTFEELLGPRVVARGVKAAAQMRVHQGRTVGHPAQLGGVLVVGTDGSIAYAHMAEDASDNPPNEEVLEAAARASDQA